MKTKLTPEQKRLKEKEKSRKRYSTEGYKEYIRKYRKEKRKNDPELVARQKEYDRLKYLKKREEILARVKLYEQENKDSIRKTKRKYRDDRELTDELYAFTESVRRNVRFSFKKSMFSKTGRTEQIIGCSFKEFRNHIISLFKPGMTLENHGKVWHLDHVIPLVYAKCLFVNLDKQREMTEKLCHYTNYQPLFWKDNLSKGGKFLNI